MKAIKIRISFLLVICGLALISAEPSGHTPEKDAPAPRFRAAKAVEKDGRFEPELNSN